MFQTILIAIDPESDKEGPAALAVGLELLDEGGELHLASVYDPGGTAFFPHVPEQAPEEQETAVRDKLDLMARKYLPLNQDATIHVVPGTADSKLVALAGTTGADLLILASQGSGGHWPLPRHTVEYVAVNAPCAVLVLPKTQPAEQVPAGTPDLGQE